MEDAEDKIWIPYSHYGGECPAAALPHHLYLPLLSWTAEGNFLLPHPVPGVPGSLGSCCRGVEGALGASSTSQHSSSPWEKVILTWQLPCEGRQLGSE